MKKAKFIRIDETPPQLFSQSFKELMKGPKPFIIIDAPFEEIIKTDSFTTSFTKGNSFNPLFKTREEERFSSFPGGLNSNVSNSSLNNGVEIPSYLIAQVIKTNNLIIEFNTELEQRGVLKTEINEFQHDSFKIGLKISEGILLQFSNPWLSSREFDLAKIHTENTIINLENFEEEQIGPTQKIRRLKQHCLELIFVIAEMKNYFGLAKL